MDVEEEVVGLVVAGGFVHSRHDREVQHCMGIGFQQGRCIADAGCC